MKSAIAVLTRGYKKENKYNLLIKRNKLIKDLIVEKIKNISFDVIIFHEGNIPSRHQEYIQSFTKEMKITFINVADSFDQKNNRINLDLCPPNKRSERYSVGYKHMCHFWSIDFIEYLKEYKYILRIDEDCILDKFDETIFDYMLNHNIYFCSPHFVNKDDRDYIVGLEKFWNSCIDKYVIQSKIKEFKQIVFPYTNFMIFDMEKIKNNQIIKQILYDLHECGCIYSNRWGDLPIWGMIICTLFDKINYYENTNIVYYHGSHKKNINKRKITDNLLDIFLNKN